MSKYNFTANRFENTRIGLLGGSFNPAHEGHLYITQEAMKRFNLKKVYWLVAKQNPHKSADQSETFRERMNSAIEIAQDPRIIVTDFESKQKSNYSIDTIKQITKQHPNAQFLWLMGSDIVSNFHHWKNWHEIVRSIPIAIFDRHNDFYKNLGAPLLKTYKNGKVIESAFLGDLSLFSWYYVRIHPNPESSTRIRSMYKNGNWFKKQKVS